MQGNEVRCVCLLMRHETRAWHFSQFKTPYTWRWVSLYICLLYRKTTTLLINHLTVRYDYAQILSVLNMLDLKYLLSEPHWEAKFLPGLSIQSRRDISSHQISQGPIDGGIVDAVAVFWVRMILVLADVLQQISDRLVVSTPGSWNIPMEMFIRPGNSLFVYSTIQGPFFASPTLFLFHYHPAPPCLLTARSIIDKTTELAISFLTHFE